MKNTLLRILLAGQLLALMVAAPAWPQATSGSSTEVTCAASGGASTEVFVAQTRRMGWLITNTSDTDVRIGIISGTATTTLTTGNSILLKTGSSLSDSQPGVFIGRLTCQSTTAVAKAVGVFWTYR